jgi:GH24 family phage-related lysozyme (muramidase)
MDFRQFLTELEGDTDTEHYLDSKGNPTVGMGVNKRAPAAQEYIKAYNLDENNLTPEQVTGLEDYMMNDTHKNYEKMRDNHFPRELNPAQETALKSMIYNAGPDIIGPNMRQHLNKKADLDVIREMILNSNRENDPGLLKRRIREAEMYGGPVDFNMAVKSMNSDELSQLRSTISKIQNEHELKRIQEKYPFLNEDYQQPFNPLKFNKLERKGLLRRPDNK